MVTEIAQASAQLIQLVDDLLHQTQTRRLDAASAQAQADVEAFRDDLLAHRLDRLNLRLASLQHGILVHLADAEAQRLRADRPEIDSLALLGLYARARAADLAAECGQILQATASTTPPAGRSTVASLL